MPGTVWEFENLQNRHQSLPSQSFHSSERDRHNVVTGSAKAPPKIIKEGKRIKSVREYCLI